MRRPEHALQKAVTHMLNIVLDTDYTWWTSIDHGVGRLGVREAASRKARGVKPGIPDILIMFDTRKVICKVIGIELKIGKGKLSPSQTGVHAHWLKLGCVVHVARSLEEVQEILEFCNVPMRSRMTVFKEVVDERPARAAAARHRRPRRRRQSKAAVPVVLA